MAALATSTIIVIVIIAIVVVLLLMGIIFAMTYRNGRLPFTTQPPESTTQIHYTATDPRPGQRVENMVDLAALRARFPQRELRPAELAAALQTAVDEQVRDHVLGFHDPVAHVAIELDLTEFVKQPDLIAATKATPLVAVPCPSYRRAPRKVDALETETPRGIRADRGDAADIESFRAAFPFLYSPGREKLDPAQDRLPLLEPRIFAMVVKTKSEYKSESKRKRRQREEEEDNVRLEPGSGLLYEQLTRVVVSSHRYIDAKRAFFRDRAGVARRNREALLNAPPSDKRNGAQLSTIAVQTLDELCALEQMRQKEEREKAEREYEGRDEDPVGVTTLQVVRGHVTATVLHDYVGLDLPGDHGLTIALVVDGETQFTVAAVPARLRVCWRSEALWKEYEEPVKLELGRWCLRAEATNMPDEYGCEPRASSRVYTVQKQQFMSEREGIE
jgi:hypothetical protein